MGRIREQELRNKLNYRLEDIEQVLLLILWNGDNLMESMDRLAAAVDAAVAKMAEAAEDLKWLKDHPVVQDNPDVAAKADELAGKLSAAFDGLKSETDTVPPVAAPAPEPTPVVEAPVEAPVTEEVPVTEAPVEPTE